MAVASGSQAGSGASRAGGRFYDGVHPLTHAVTASVSSSELTIVFPAAGQPVRWALADIEVASDPWHEPHALLVNPKFPGTRLAIDDAGFRVTLSGLGRHLTRAAPRKARVLPVLAGLLAGLALTVGALAYAVEEAPDLVAPFVPFALERQMGAAVVDAIRGDAPACERREGQAALDRMMTRLVAVSDYPHPLKVQVMDMRSGPGGRGKRVVNAFAVPGGQMVLMMGLIEDAADPDELAGVMAHELGHVIHRHSVKALLRAYGFGVLTRLLTGGFSGDVATLSDLGGVLLALRHGRDAEREADATALQLLDGASMRADGLSRFFEKLLTMQKGDDAAEKMGVFSTHPPTRERIDATRREKATGQPAMTAAEWKALKAICD